MFKHQQLLLQPRQQQQPQQHQLQPQQQLLQQVSNIKLNTPHLV